jgi:hypothetical protein
MVWVGAAVLAAASGAWAQGVVFTRPGTMIVTELAGETSAVVGEAGARPLKKDERLRAEVVFRTGRRSSIGVEFANGTRAKVGSESEVAVPEFWQQPHSQTGKMADWKAEPSPSRTRLTVGRGDLMLQVKPLKVAGGSSLTVEVNAGVVRISDGVLRARVQSTEVGIGLCTLELESGRAELERLGGAVTPLVPGKPLVLAVETDRKTGAVTISEAPRPEGAK